MFDKKKMFSAEAPAHGGQADTLNPGSAEAKGEGAARQSPSEGGRNINMFKKMITFAAVAGLVLALGPAPAGAAIIAEDGFATGGGSDYTTDGDINGQNPTRTGFNAAWAGGAGRSYSMAGGLAVPANGTVGAVGATGGSNGHFQTNNNTGNNYRNMSAGSTASEMWVRWLWDPTGSDSGWLTITTTGDDLTVNFDASEMFKIKYAGGDYTTTVSLSGAEHLVVLHIDIDRSGSAADDVRVWIDPDSYSDLASLSNPDLTLTGGNIFEGAGELERLACDFNGVGTRFDEFAVGTQLSDILVPEPSTLALLGLGGLGVLLRRRRR